MHSNDQLFGLSLTLLRSPSSPNSNMKSTLTILIHQRETIDLILDCSTPALLYLCINTVNTRLGEVQILLQTKEKSRITSFTVAHIHVHALYKQAVKMHL